MIWKLFRCDYGNQAWHVTRAEALPSSIRFSTSFSHKLYVQQMDCFPYLRHNVLFVYILSREKGITTLRIYQYWIFHHAVIETCFDMLKSSEHEKSWRYSNKKFLIFKIVLNLDCWSPNLILLLNSNNRGPYFLSEAN